MADPTQARIRELFELDAEAGRLVWRIRPVEDFPTVRSWKMWNTQFAGTIAGYVRSDGYRLIWQSGRQWMAHRLIWIYVNGDIPDGLQIDHISRVRDDNHLDNLRLVTHAENMQNQSLPKNNKSGVVGVCWNKKPGRRWYAQIKVDGRKRYLGSFDNIADAAKARAKAELDFGFHLGHGRPLTLNADTGNAKGSAA